MGDFYQPQEDNLLNKLLSSHRQRVRFLIRKPAQLERVAMGRSPMMAASFLSRRLRAGGPGMYYLLASIRRGRAGTALFARRRCPNGGSRPWLEGGLGRQRPPG